MKSHIRRIFRLVSSIKALRQILRWFSLRGFVPQFILKRLPVEDTFVVDVSASERFSYISTYGDQTGRALYWEGKGGIDPETLEYFEKHIRKARVFADVGANVGHFTLYACAVNPALQVHAFEPVNRTFEHIRKNVELNGWSDRCALVKAAVGNMDGQIELHVPFDEYPSSASLKKEGFNNIKGELVKTPILRLDSYFRDKPLPDVLKIDVEGFENLVLEGSAGLFANGFRPVIILECNPGGPGREITDILKPLGYNLFQLRGTGPFACESIEAHEGDRYRNWAAVSQRAA